jgi:hypothetical protein
MRDWVDNLIAVFLVLRACLWVAQGVRDLRCRRNEESVSVGFG